jgi:hypothetical protein
MIKFSDQHNNLSIKFNHMMRNVMENNILDMIRLDNSIEFSTRRILDIRKRILKINCISKLVS